MSGGGPDGTPPPAPGPVKKWWLGARPRTLPAAIVPVVVSTAAAHPRHLLSLPSAARLTTAVATGPKIDAWWCALGALIVALAIQIGTNYANDYSDGIRGTDDARVGPVRLTASGLASPGAVKRAALLAFAVAGVVGLGLAWATSWWILLVGAACLLAGWFYTGGPRPYGYAGLGEVFVFAFFGLLATAGSAYIQVLRVPTVVWPAAVAVGLLATILLEANNLRDINGDTTAGKRTVAVRLGRKAAGRFVVVLCVGVALAVILVGMERPWALLALLGLPPLVPLCRLALSPAEGVDLLPMLPSAARAQLVVGALLAVGLGNA